MRRSKAVPLALTALLASSLTACGNEPEPDNYAICVDPATEQRVEDEKCDSGGGGGGGLSGLGGFAFLYFGGINSGRSYLVPPVGSSYRNSGGTLQRPPGITQTRGISKSGGSVFKGSPAVSRGGFGKTGGRTGGGGRGGFGG